MRGPPAREPGPVPPFGATDAWWALGARLAVSDGVHRPSRFSAALSAHLPTVTGAHVVDVGCGAGLVSVAALARGAAHVIAMDRDPAAMRQLDDSHCSRATGHTSACCAATSRSRTRTNVRQRSWLRSPPRSATSTREPATMAPTPSVRCSTTAGLTSWC
jgi:hypothetical protein